MIPFSRSPVPVAALLTAASLWLLPARADDAEPTPLDISNVPTPTRTLTEPQPALANDPGRHVTPGKYEGNWDSLKQYQPPDWFRDAKFGIWAHWTAQCVPEQGDWYARLMYNQGGKDYNYQVAHYGPPSKVGFKDIDNLWHAENWDPDKLMQLYVKAGAKYFVALANHHDNFDCYDSKYQPWNSVNMGPKKDIVGIWATTARKYGLHFGVSNHSSHAWHWLQTAYGYDTSGPYKDVPYDGWLTKADGKGQWWDGYDPQDLYCGPRVVPPPGLDEAGMKAWQKKHEMGWPEYVPPEDNGYTDKWFLRCQDLVAKYNPDLLYFDDGSLPLGQAGLDVAADFYNENLQANHGQSTAVINAKGISAGHKKALVEDLELNEKGDISPLPWQTDTCIGIYHYNIAIFRNHSYKKVSQVVQMLCDIVSKNGNLLLSIPLKGDGTIDSDEEAFLAGMAKWMAVNSEGIFSTRPWLVYGEGAQQSGSVKNLGNGQVVENERRGYDPGDIRFTTKGDQTLYAFFYSWPESHQLTIRSLSKGGTDDLLEQDIQSISLLGSTEPVTWTQDADGLHVTLPAIAAPSEGTCAIKIGLSAPSGKVTHAHNILTPDDPIVALIKTAQGQPSVAAPEQKDDNQGALSVLDGDTGTKYFNHDRDDSNPPGVNTGFVVAPKAGSTVVTRIQFATGGDLPKRDPLAITLEGSNDPGAPGDAKNFTSIYSGSTGLESTTERSAWGAVVPFQNSTPYTTYRVLVTGTRDDTSTDAVQYSEVRLMGVAAPAGSP